MTAADRLLRLFSPPLGPIVSVRELASSPDQARLPAFIAETADLRTIHGGPIRRLSGSGIHYHRDAAVAAAIGEAVERYCGAAAPDDLPLAAAARLGEPAAAPDRYVLFHPWQYAAPGFRYRPFAASTPVRWTRAHDLLAGGPHAGGAGGPVRTATCVPAQLVYLGADAAPFKGEVPIGYATSSGMACAPTPEEAVLAGLLEVIERDAVMAAWYLRLSPRRIRWRASPEAAVMDDRCFAPSGLRYVCLDLSEPLGLSTVLAVVFGTAVGLAVGAACALAPEDAWLKAMREAFATYAWADRLVRTSAPIPSGRLESVQTFADHVRFYAAPAHLPLASFLWQNREERDLADLPRINAPDAAGQLAAVADRLRAAGAGAYAVDLTTDDVRRVGLHVWKVLSPELQPLDVGYARRFLGGRRLPALASRLAGREATSPDALNPWPHPFP